MVLMPVVAVLLRVEAMEGRRSARRVAVSGTPPEGWKIEESLMVREKALVFVGISNFPY